MLALACFGSNAELIGRLYRGVMGCLMDVEAQEDKGNLSLPVFCVQKCSPASCYKCKNFATFKVLIWENLQKSGSSDSAVLKGRRECPCWSNPFVIQILFMQSSS